MKSGASTLKPSSRGDAELGMLGFAEAINAADLDSAADCFVKNACFITPDATAVRGREEIRAVLFQLIARDARIDVLARSVIVGDGVAWSSERWRICVAGTEGTTFEQLSQPTAVLRCLEGEWKLAIAAPWGLRHP